MPKGVFQFKQFAIRHEQTAMKVGTDSVLLGSWADHPNPERILDAGAGSGILALMAAQRFPDSEVYAVELEQGAASEAKWNAFNSPFSQRIHVVCENLFLFKNPHAFDLIISNPPWFSNALKAPSPERNLARHVPKDWDLQHWMLQLNDLLALDGRIATILPSSVHQALEYQLSSYGLFSIETLEVRSNSKQASPLRTLSIWSKKEPKVRKRNALVLYDSNGKRSQDYSKLCWDFYL